MRITESNFYSETSHSLLFTCFDSKKQRKTDSFRVHHHAELELGYICSGEGDYILADSRFHAKAGDLFLVRANEQHCVPTVYTDELVSFNIHFSSYFLWNICAEYIPFGVLRVLVCNSPVKHCFCGMGGEILEIKELCENAENNRFEIKLKMVELMCKIARKIGAEQDGGAIYDFTEFKHIDDIQNAIAYINTHLTEKIKLGDIAKNSRMSSSHLSSVFKKHTGVTPYEYLLLQRVDRAAAMLRRTDISVLNLAGECGFGSLANFNKIFKKVTGMTPSEYRKSKQNNQGSGLQ